MENKTYSITQEERFALDLTIIICKWRARELEGQEAMILVDSLNIQNLKNKNTIVEEIKNKSKI